MAGSKQVEIRGHAESVRGHDPQAQVLAEMVANDPAGSIAPGGVTTLAAV